MKTHCKRGHPRVAENLYRSPKGDSRCRICHRLASKIWQKENPESVYNTKIKRNYGIDLQIYKKMLKDQGGVCAISKQSPAKRRLVVDHSHISGKRRQLLAPDINIAIGLFQENPEWLRAAADYIDKWRKDHEGGGTSGIS